MKNYIFLFIILLAGACSDSEPATTHPFKFEGLVSQEDLHWQAPDFQYNYIQVQDADHQEDSIAYGFSLFQNTNWFSVKTRKMASGEFDSFFEPGVHTVEQNTFDFMIILHTISYTPRSGQFEITRKETDGNKVRVWGTLNCELEVASDHPGAANTQVKDALLVVEFEKAP